MTAASIVIAVDVVSFEVVAELPNLRGLRACRSMNFRAPRTSICNYTSIKPPKPLPTTMSQRVCTRLRPSHLTSKSLSYQPHHQQWLLITNPQLHRTRKPNPHGIPPQHRRASSMRESRGNPRRPSQPSVAVAQARQQRVALEAGDLPDDVGLLPGTLVMPTGRNRPGWFGQFKERWMLEKRRWWTRGVGLVE